MASACSSSRFYFPPSKHGCAHKQVPPPCAPCSTWMKFMAICLPPPSRHPKARFLRMLKQARAFGLGLLLATQNPVDMDYKALSNTGTWFIGKLQTERDKNRLLDGLESAAGGIPRAAMDKLISSLGKRVFVMHNVHEKMPVLIQTRWAMNFLAGPMTRAQIPALNQLVDAGTTLRTAPIPASLPGAVPAPKTSATPQPSVEALQPVSIPSAVTACCIASTCFTTQSSIVNRQSPIGWEFNQTLHPRRHSRIFPPAELQPARSISICTACHAFASHDPGCGVSSVTPRRRPSEIA